MKWLVIVFLLLCIVGLLGYIAMAIMSQKMPDHLGLKDGLLAACPSSPNCVCSEKHTKTDAQHFIQAIDGNDKIWARFKHIAIEQGGHIETDSGDYMHITFSTAIFHYVDDVEARFDRDKDLIHIRSASRIGRSDFGVNRKRMETIKRLLGSTK